MPTSVDLRKLPMPKPSERSKPPTDVDTPGSNNFAVSGALTADGRAIVADDMHLGLRAPNIWFRARLRYADARAPDGRVDITGFTLPGLPAVVVGSNMHVAWGFTNSYLDALDWKRVRPCTRNTRGADCDAIATHTETIAVADGAPVTLTVEDTGWGPIVHKEADGSALALRWIAHLPGALNFGLADFAYARDLDDALRIANRTALPTQNLAIADRSGRIAWRLLGPIALRSAGCDARAQIVNDAAPDPRTAPSVVPSPVSGRGRREAPGEGPAFDSDAEPAPRCAPWPISTAASPLLASPTIDRLWTANARVIDGDALARIGDGGYAFGARAKQIRDGLFAKEAVHRTRPARHPARRPRRVPGAWWRLLRDVASMRDGAPALHALADAAKNGTAAPAPTRSAIASSAPGASPCTRAS